MRNPLLTLPRFLLLTAWIATIQLHAHPLASSANNLEQQTKLVVSGIVKDDTGVPIPGTSVFLKGTTLGVNTDADGKYTLEVEDSQGVLIFSFIGFKTQEIAINNLSTIDVALQTDLTSLDEVVVVGYTQKNRSEIIGSVATIAPEQLQDIPAPNIAAAMRGQIVGVSVNQVSGRPGAPISLNIRNASTSPTGGGSTEPLYIIDNIRVTREDFDNLDLSMVESISFLKDASAAIYGASGSKGVILITTKRGKAGKTSITYNGYVGQSDAARKPNNMLSAYEHAVLMNEINSVKNSASSTFFSEEDLEYIKGLNYKSWFDELWQPSLTQRHNVSISGGSEKLTFFAGGSYTNENANYAGMNYDKYTFRSGITADVGKGLKADVAFNVDHTVRNARHSISDNDANFIESIITTPRWVPIRLGDNFINYSTNSVRNPLAILESGYRDTRKTQGYRINASLTYQPQAVKGLTARFQISQASGGARSRLYEAPFKAYNYLRAGQNQQLYKDPGELDPTTPSFDVITIANSRITPGLSTSNSYQGFFTLDYTKTLGLHSISAQVGGEQSRSFTENLSVRWSNQLIPGGQEWWAFDVNTITQNGVNTYEATKRSFFGRFNYDFDKKYLLEAIVRRDASSNFALGNRWRWSPSIGVGWVVSKEDFFANNVAFVNFMKVKLNYGITGDDRFGTGQRIWQDRYTIDTSNGYLFGNANSNGLNPAELANPDITWEKKKTINFGIEMSLFGNKLDIAADFFKNKVYDGFDKGGPDITPLYAGFLPPIINYREASNWGQEFTIGYKARVAREIKVNVGINFAYGNSIVTRTLYAPGKLVEPNLEDGLADAFGTDPRTYNGSNYGLIYKGTFRTQQEVDVFLEQNPNYRLNNSIPQVGWMYFEDTNKDGIINDWDIVPMYKNSNPFFAPGINLGISYKSLSLKTSITARFGGKIAYDGRARTAPTLTKNVTTIWRDRWSPENPNGHMPRSDDPFLTRNSTFWMVDGTMARVNNMTLSYQVPSKLVTRLGFQDVRIMATGNNLWVLINPLKYKDPNTSSAYDYPILRTISLGLNVKL